MGIYLFMVFELKNDMGSCGNEVRELIWEIV